MILTKQFLNELVQKQIITESLQYSRQYEDNEYDVFISYSLHDKDYAKKVVGLLRQCGYSAYADYDDIKLDRNNVSVKTARRLIEKMKKCKALFYLYSKSSSVSKWCPWEIGLFSGIKKFKCANLPILEKAGDTYKNQEYLGLYDHVEYSKSQAGNDDIWIYENDGKYVRLLDWLNGAKPYKHE